jgi:hypothetical protein
MRLADGQIRVILVIVTSFLTIHKHWGCNREIEFHSETDCQIFPGGLMMIFVLPDLMETIHMTEP